MSNIIDTLKDLSSAVSQLAQRLQDIWGDLEAMVKDCDELSKEIDDLQEAADE